MVCFDLILDQQMLPAVALASAVSLKNFVRENWVCTSDSFFLTGLLCVISLIFQGLH